MKTKTTKELERLIFFESKADQLGTYGAFEVALGEAYGNEYVDYMTMNSAGEFRCYEIKQSYSDLHSKAKLSFHGDYNYLVMTEELYEEAINKGDNNWFNIGIYIRKYDSKGVPFLSLIKKAPKRTVAPWKRYELTHCMVRSLSRLTTEKMKNYQEKIKETQEASKNGKKISCPICGKNPKILKLTENGQTTYKLTCPDHPNSLPFVPSRASAIFYWNNQESRFIQQLILEDQQKETEEQTTEKN